MDVENTIEDGTECDFDDFKCQFPISKVKGICKLDPDCDIINPEAVKLIAKATEYFIEEFAKACYTQAILDKRKTVQTKDIDRVIETTPAFEFLEDSLDGWLDDVLAGERDQQSQNDDDLLEDDTLDDDIAEEMEEVQVSSSGEKLVEDEEIVDKDKE